MKPTLTIAVCILSAWISCQAQAKTEPVPCGAETGICDPVKFDEWGDILFSDEKARLDNAALQLKQAPSNIIYLVVYAGQVACPGEAKARGLRAKKHLMSRRIPPAQVVWIDGGYQKEVTTEVWIWPPDVGKPSVFPEFNLKPAEVTLEKNCKIKRRPSRRYQ
jgi:hypothetical protein